MHISYFGHHKHCREGLIKSSRFLLSQTWMEIVLRSPEYIFSGFALKILKCSLELQSLAQLAQLHHHLLIWKSGYKHILWTWSVNMVLMTGSWTYQWFSETLIVSILSWWLGCSRCGFSHFMITNNGIGATLWGSKNTNRAISHIVIFPPHPHQIIYSAFSESL